MNHYKLETVSKLEKKLIKTTCDICNNEIKNLEFYKFDEVTISHRYGERWPEGGNSETLDLDICPECFKNKILPFIEKLANKNFTYSESDW